MKLLKHALVLSTVIISANVFAAKDPCLSNGGSIENASIVNGKGILRVCAMVENVGYEETSLIGYNDLLSHDSGRQVMAIDTFKNGKAGDRMGTDLGRSICLKVDAQFVQLRFSAHPEVGALSFCRFKDGSIINAISLIMGPQSFKSLAKAVQ